MFCPIPLDQWSAKFLRLSLHHNFYPILNWRPSDPGCQSKARITVSLIYSANRKNGLPHKHSDVQPEKKMFITTFFLNPWALRYISCLVHLNCVDLIKTELSIYNIYLTEKSVTLSFYEITRELQRAFNQARQANSPVARAIASVFSLCYILLKREQKADWFPHCTNGRHPPRGLQSWGGDCQ